MPTYTNDASDRALRVKHYWLYVYMIPAAIFIAISFGVYFAYKNYELPANTIVMVFLICASPAFYLHNFQNKKWLKMPDGSYCNVENEQSIGNVYIQEPTAYDHEFGYHKAFFITPVFILLMMAVIGIYTIVMYKNFLYQGILIMTVSVVYGCILGYKLLDKSTKLKIAKTGIWTIKLGFKHWDSVKNAEIIIDNSGKNKVTNLHIRLKGTKFEEANVADEILNIGALVNNLEIQTLINESIVNYNASKK